MQIFTKEFNLSPPKLFVIHDTPNSIHGRALHPLLNNRVLGLIRKSCVWLFEIKEDMTLGRKGKIEYLLNNGSLTKIGNDKMILLSNKFLKFYRLFFDVDRIGYELLNEVELESEDIEMGWNIIVDKPNEKYAIVSQRKKNFCSKVSVYELNLENYSITLKARIRFFEREKNFFRSFNFIDDNEGILKFSGIGDYDPERNYCVFLYEKATSKLVLRKFDLPNLMFMYKLIKDKDQFIGISWDNIILEIKHN